MSNEQNYMCIIYIYTFSLTWKRSQFPGAEVLSWFLVSYSIFIAIPWQDHSSTIESRRRDRKHGSLALHRDLEGNWKGNADTVYCNVLQITGKNWNRCFFSWFLYTFFLRKMVSGCRNFFLILVISIFGVVRTEKGLDVVENTVPFCLRHGSWSSPNISWLHLSWSFPVVPARFHWLQRLDLTLVCLASLCKTQVEPSSENRLQCTR